MAASTLLDNLQAQFRSKNVSGTIPNTQVDLATNYFGSSENLHHRHLSMHSSVQWDLEHGNDPGYVLFNSLDTD